VIDHMLRDSRFLTLTSPASHAPSRDEHKIFVHVFRCANGFWEYCTACIYVFRTFSFEVDNRAADCFLSLFVNSVLTHTHKEVREHSTCVHMKIQTTIHMIMLIVYVLYREINIKIRVDFEEKQLHLSLLHFLALTSPPSHAHTRDLHHPNELRWRRT
jgi:hypothetical protein